MKAFLIILVIVVSVLVIGGVVYAKKGGCSGPEGRMGWMIDRVSKRLNLDEMQRSKLVSLKDQLIEVKGEFNASRADGRKQVAQLLEEPVLDQSQAQALFDGVRDQASGHSREVIEAIAGFTDSLNQEQRSQLMEWMNHKRNGRFGRHNAW